MMPLVLVIPVIGAALVLHAVIGLLVWRDANRRGLSAALWTLAAVLVPGFLGLLVYLLYVLFRGERAGLRCPVCGGPVERSFVACPGCGAALRAEPAKEPAGRSPN